MRFLATALLILGAACSARSPEPEGTVDKALPPPEAAGPAAPCSEQICTPGGWCWQNPLPQGNRLFGVFVRAADDVYAVGNGGTILRYDGQRWCREESGTHERLYAVWGDDKRLFAVGTKVILRHDGKSWQSEPLPEGVDGDLVALWSRPGLTDVLAAGRDKVLRWHAGRWSVDAIFPGRVLEGIWGSDANDFYAVGYPGTIVHWDGKSWQATVTGDTQWLEDIWGSGPNDVYAVGWNGSVLHFDGTKWTPIHHGLTESTLSGVWGSGPADVHAVALDGEVLHFDGARWTKTPGGLVRDDVHGLGSDRVISVGGAGSIWQFDGASWTASDGPGAERPLTAVWRASDGRAVAVGHGGTALHFANGRWERKGTGTFIELEGVWGMSPDDVFAVGWEGTILHYDGKGWRRQPWGDKLSFYDIWGASASNVFVVGDHGTILHYDGVTWTRQSSPAKHDLNGIWGTGPADVYAVGRGGTILHYDGTSWALLDGGGGVNDRILLDVWGSGSHDVFAVGAGLIVHFDGQSWSDTVLPGDEWLRGVAGPSGTNVFAVGDRGATFRFDGKSWSAAPSETVDLLAIVADASGFLAVGDDSAILEHPP